MNTSEARLFKTIGDSIEALLNYHNVAIVTGWMVGKQLRTMGSTLLRIKFEKEFRSNRGWEKTFRKDKQDMMDLDDDQLYINDVPEHAERLDTEAKLTSIPPNLPREIDHMNFNQCCSYLCLP